MFVYARDAAMLTNSQIDSYHHNGYISVEDVLSGDDLSELRSVTDSFLEQSRSVSENNEVFDLESNHSPEQPQLRRLKDPINQHEIFKRIMRYEKILSIVSQLIGEAIRCNGSKLNFKLPGFGSAVEWHQDWAFYPHTNDDLLAVGVALDEMNDENGPLLVVPGSHKGPTYDHHQDGHFCGAITDPQLQIDAAIPLIMKAGGITIHHVRLLHGSRKNSSDIARRLLLFQYAAVDAWPLMGISSFEEFNAQIIRGGETNIPRFRHAPVRMPFPKPLKEGSIYESQSVLRKSTFQD